MVVEQGRVWILFFSSLRTIDMDSGLSDAWPLGGSAQVSDTHVHS